MFNDNRPTPDEVGRRCFTLIGTVVGNTVIDTRTFFTKYLSQEFPNVPLFQRGIHYMVRILFDRASYLEAGPKLKVHYPNHPPQMISMAPYFEVPRDEMEMTYRTHLSVGVSFRILSATYQFFTGSPPVDYELKRIRNMDDLMKTVCPIIPPEAKLFFM